jgi:hypothetical protein
MTETLNLSDSRAEAYKRAYADRGEIAFVAVTPSEKMEGIRGALALAIANERGYTPIPLGWARYASHDAAADHADHLNRAIGLSDNAATMIIISTMGGRRYSAA